MALCFVRPVFGLHICLRRTLSPIRCAEDAAFPHSEIYL